MTKGKRHKPIRTCVACRAKREKDDLVRLILDDQGRALIDKEKRASGRGAYVCPDRSCLQGVLKRSILSRAFRAEVRIDGLQFPNEVSPKGR